MAKNTEVKKGRQWTLTVTETDNGKEVRKDSKTFNSAQEFSDYLHSHY